MLFMYFYVLICMYRFMHTCVYIYIYTHMLHRLPDASSSLYICTLGPALPPRVAAR